MQFDLEEAEAGEWGEDVDFGGVLAKSFDGADAVGVEDIVNVRGEVVADGDGGEGDARGPLFDEFLDVEEAVVAGGFKVFGELRGGEVGWGVELRQGFGTDGPDGGDPREVGAGNPLVGEVMPEAGADGGFDLLAGFEGEEGGVADEDGGVSLLQHGDGVGCGREEGWAGVEEFAEEGFGVGEGAAGGGIGGDGADRAEGVGGFRVGRFNDELDGADFVE
ncbi:MAG: hypothetical protein JWQ49_5308 [Edaphobacter sp.]|nr:hypothetical protein [Edaphobacter sp.]